MLLAIDVGNTNAVLGCFAGRELRKTWRVSTHPLCTADEFRARLAAVAALDGVSPRDFEAVVVSSVVPPWTAMLRSAFSGQVLHVIDHRSPFSFEIRAEPAAQVGADRLVNAEAAIRDHGAPVIIVDSGTATTVCAVSRRREYLGGAIMPGLELSLEALARKAAQLSVIELVVPPRAIGANTSEAMRSGILLGYASMIDGMVARFRAELGEPDAPVVATGGISQLLKDNIQRDARDRLRLDPDLTLKGIQYLYEALRAR